MFEVSYGWKFWTMITVAVVIGIVRGLIEVINDYLNEGLS
jgi:hypothetical protein